MKFEWAERKHKSKLEGLNEEERKPGCGKNSASFLPHYKTAKERSWMNEFRKAAIFIFLFSFIGCFQIHSIFSFHSALNLIWMNEMKPAVNFIHRFNWIKRGIEEKKDGIEIWIAARAAFQFSFQFDFCFVGIAGLIWINAFWIWHCHSIQNPQLIQASNQSKKSNEAEWN